MKIINDFLHEIGKLFQNLNTWKDVRADYVVQSWNKGFTFKVPYSSIISENYL